MRSIPFLLVLLSLLDKVLVIDFQMAAT